jgi:hypothetical protein
MKVYCTDEVCDWIKGRCCGGRDAERGWLVTGEENTLFAKIIPIGREVGKSNPPFLILLVWVGLP